MPAILFRLAWCLATVAAAEEVANTGFLVRRDSSNCGTNFNKICNAETGDTIFWVSGTGWRSSFEILWSALAVYFLCSWSILRLNIPAIGTSSWTRFCHKFKWAFIAFFWPELIAINALFEYWDASKSLTSMLSLCINHWTITHAFFANMGGFMFSSENASAFCVTGSMLEILIREGYLEAPDIDEEEIKDKSKTDVFTQIFTVAQSMWLVLHCVARGASGLPVTAFEFTAVLHFAISVVTYGLQWNKPKDVERAIVLKLGASLSEDTMKSLCEEYNSRAWKKVDDVTKIKSLSNAFQLDNLDGIKNPVLSIMSIWLLLCATFALRCAFSHAVSGFPLFLRSNIAGSVFCFLWPATFLNVQWGLLVWVIGFGACKGLSFGASIPVGLVPETFYTVDWIGLFPHL